MNKNYVKQWFVPSDTNSEKVYKVSEKRDGKFVCSCPHNIFKKLECKHIEHVLRFEVSRASVASVIARLRATNIKVIA